MASSTNHNTDKPKREYKVWTDDETCSLLTLYTHDITYAEIARLLGRTPQAIQQRVHKLRVQGVIDPDDKYRTRSEPQPKPKRDEEQLDLFTDVEPPRYGVSVTGIADQAETTAKPLIPEWVDKLFMYATCSGIGFAAGFVVAQIVIN